MDDGATRALVDRARRGDGEAFGQLFHSFEADVARLCTRLLGSSDEARDAAHETFLRARNAFESYDPGRPFRPWLLAIASHHAVDRLRRRSTERRLFAPDEADPETLAAPGRSPLQRELDEAARREMLAAIRALPDRYRAPLVLRYYADLDYGAIALALGVSRNQVGTLLLRGRHRLREQLESRREEDAP